MGRTKGETGHPPDQVKGERMKATFEIEWPTDLGIAWMNVDNLMLCINAYCSNPDGAINARAVDITDIRREAAEEMREDCEEAAHLAGVMFYERQDPPDNRSLGECISSAIKNTKIRALEVEK